MKKENLVIFGNSTSFVTCILLDSLLNEIRLEYGDRIGILFFVDTVTLLARVHGRVKLIYTLVGRIFNKGFPYRKFLIFSVNHVCRKNGVRLIRTKNSSINDQEFVEGLKDLNPTIAVIIGCPQIMKRNLIDVFQMVVNYHNGYLPKYRGIYATHWSLYFSETYTGFSYHVVNEKIDDGNILLQDFFETTNTQNVFLTEIEKTQKAASYWTEVLQMILNRSIGAVQTGHKCYFGQKDLRAIRNIPDASHLTSMELKKRMTIFEYIKIQINGKLYFVRNIYEVKHADKYKGKFFFRTKDGRYFHVLSFTNIVYHLYYKLKESMNSRLLFS